MNFEPSMPCLDAALSNRSLTSPFERIIAIDYYDGPVRGFAFCRGSLDGYLFRMEAWDDHQSERIFSLAPLDHRDGSALLELASHIEAARRPVWAVDYTSRPEMRPMHEAIVVATKRASEIEWILRTPDLLGSYSGLAKISGTVKREEFRRLSTRAQPDEEVSDGSFSEWMKLLG